MGRAPCCDKMGVKKGPWTAEEDKILVEYIQKNGQGCWRDLPRQAGLLRCGKSCRLRWTNYLRPDVKRGPFQPEEERTILQLHAILGNRWSTIASQLPRRTDNEIKNFWNTHLKKKLLRMGLDPSTHVPISEIPSANGLQGSQSTALLRHSSQWEIARLEAEARLSRDSILSSKNKLIGNHNADANSKAPTDFFLKLWNSDAGKAFRKESVINNNNIENPHGYVGRTDTSTHLTLSPLSPFSSAFNLDQENINKEDDSAAGSCNPSSKAVVRGQTEGKKPIHNDSSNSDELIHGNVAVHNHDIQDLTDLLLDSPSSNMAELCTNFQLQSPWAWQELQLDEDNDY
ncbi:hypothetical protein SUGI_0225170 [Cryptomeria japonica]|uniref:transcription factor MYB17-like n=1 Tax=Cryptomeria japonica TaxID=3369 RepID=UPI002408DBC8|nr:transcription factor MYB17-like [Cryptomeria japonica]GLJ14070.1 hypothetical protein SUGI_0225170 [Cryptomeria japonica]